MSGGPTVLSFGMGLSSGDTKFHGNHGAEAQTKWTPNMSTIKTDLKC